MSALKKEVVEHGDVKVEVDFHEDTTVVVVSEQGKTRLYQEVRTGVDER